MHFPVEELLHNTSTLVQQAQLYSVLAYMARFRGQLDLYAK